MPFSRRLLVCAFFFEIAFANAASAANAEDANSYFNFAATLQNFLRKADSGVSARCSDHLLRYKKDLEERELWAIRMFDARGKLPSGIIVGNFIDLGSFDECLNVEKELNNSETIAGKYCIGKIPLDANSRKITDIMKILKVATPDGKKGIQLATCAPDSCSANDLQLIYSEFDVEMLFYEDLCQTKAKQPSITIGTLVGISFFGMTLVLLVVSTAYDVALYYLKKRPAHYILVSFSMYTNGKKLLETSNNSKQIHCLHGLRVISTMWIMLDHRFSIQYGFPTRNYFYKEDWIKNKANMFMLSATISVDTFFLLAGTVLSYTFLNSAAKGAKFNIFMHYIHRYLRLTPMIAALIIFIVTILRHLGSGPLWPNMIETQLIKGCEDFWWKTLLYIQNYGRQSTMCIPHGWYLSADMQLFLLSPAFLLTLKKWPKFAIIFTGFLAICSMAACFLIAWFFELSFNMRRPTDFEKQMQFVWYYYFPAYTRAAPWLFGIILGYFIFKSKQQIDSSLIINKKIVLSLWIIALTILCACVFCGHNLIVGDYERLANAFHIAFVRPSWAVALSWVVFACVNGYGGPVNWFLSAPIFQVTSKLTYALYLVHYILIYVITSQMRTTIVFNNFQAMYMFWGDFAFTLAASVFLSLAFEFPMGAIEKFLCRRGQQRVGPDEAPYKCNS